MAAGASEDDALALWLEHGARHAARASAVAAAVRESRAAALDAIRKIPGWQPHHGRSPEAPSFDLFRSGVTYDERPSSGIQAMEKARPDRAALRIARKKQRDAIGVRAQQEAAAAQVSPIRPVHAPVIAEQSRLIAKSVTKEDHVPSSLEMVERSAESQNIPPEKLPREIPKAAGSLPSSQPSSSSAHSGDQLFESSVVAVSRKESSTGKRQILETESLPSHAIQVARVWGIVSADAEKFAADPEMKRPRMLLKKRINRAANQIAASVKSVCIKISDLLGALIEASQSGIPPALAFTMKEIAQRLVAEGSGSVALSRPAAFAVGHVIVGVVANSPDPTKMRTVVLGAFFDKCPYIVPTYVRRHKNESEASYRSRLNYLVDESPDAYVERMCGFVTLYGAIVQTVDVHGPSGMQRGMRNLFSVEDGWGWLARAVNGPQRSITPDIVHAFLDVAGYELSRTFGSSFASLLATLQAVCVRQASKDARPGAKSRIDGFVEDYIRAGHKVLNPPPGKFLPISDAENKA